MRPLDLSTAHGMIVDLIPPCVSNARCGRRFLPALAVVLMAIGTGAFVPGAFGQSGSRSAPSDVPQALPTSDIMPPIAGRVDPATYRVGPGLSRACGQRHHEARAGNRHEREQG